MTSETITHVLLKELSKAGAIRKASAVAFGDRWAVVVAYGGIERTLRATNSRQVRSWANLNSVVKYLADLGIRKFDTDATNYDPNQHSTSRPDKSAALKAAHQAAAYDRWYRSQVAQGIAEADAPEAEWFSMDQVFAEIDKDLEEITGGRSE